MENEVQETKIEAGDYVRIKPYDLTEPTPITSMLFPGERAMKNQAVCRVYSASTRGIIRVDYPFPAVSQFMTFDWYTADQLELVDIETVWKIDGLCPSCGYEGIYHLDHFYGHPCNQWHCERCGYGEVSDNAPGAEPMSPSNWLPEPAHVGSSYRHPSDGLTDEEAFADAIEAAIEEIRDNPKAAYQKILNLGIRVDRLAEENEGQHGRIQELEQKNATLRRHLHDLAMLEGTTDPGEHAERVTILREYE